VHPEVVFEVLSGRHWTHAPVTTNESYHGHLNAEFNATHPNIYICCVKLQHTGWPKHGTIFVRLNFIKY